MHTVARDPAASGARLADAWERLRRVPGGRRIFGLLLRWLVPYSASVRPEVQELRPGYARLVIRDRRRLRNHVGSVHAVALANVAELASGLAMALALPAGVRGIPTRLEIDYLKKARGTLTCIGTATPPADVTGEMDAVALAEISDAGGVVVARLSARWRLGSVTGATR